MNSLEKQSHKPVHLQCRVSKEPLNLKRHGLPTVFGLKGDPVPMLERSAWAQVCMDSGGGTAANGDAKVVRSVKIFRMLRIARVMKLVKFVT